jgi:hypothetical protein
MIAKWRKQCVHYIEPRTRPDEILQDIPPYAVMEADATRMSKTFWVCADPDADKVNPSLHKSCTVLLPTDLHVSQYYPEARCPCTSCAQLMCWQLSGNEYPYLQLSVYTQVQCYHFGTSKIGFDGYMSATLHKVGRGSSLLSTYDRVASLSSRGS